MSFALSSGVTGLQAHQKMLDVTGNNLANVNTVGFKGSRIVFSELLSQILKKASQPTATVGGTNPQQIGSGVGIAGISPDMSQGNLINTNNPLDLAMEGEGYFVLSDGSQNVYTRSGGFAVDANSNLVDPSTGYIVQRIGTVGEVDGFQTPGDSNIKIPYDVAMAASATSLITVSGNLSADGILPEGAQTNVLKSNITYTTNNGTNATGSTLLSDLNQFSGAFTGDANITISGYEHNGNPLTDGGGLDFNDTTNTKDMDDLIDYITSRLQAGGGTDAATLLNGRIVITDGSSGYSRSDVKLTYTDVGDETSLTMPGYFEITTVGGEEVKNFSIMTYDSQGGSHILSGAFVRTDTLNLWDMILTSISGNVSDIDISGNSDRRINGIEFNGTYGSFIGLNAAIGDTAQFEVTFAHDTANPQTILVDMGTAGQFNGLTQFARVSTAVAEEQNGYEAGDLTSASVSNEGVIVGTFTNGVKKNLATIQLALFKNAAGLESMGNGYFAPSVNSGEAVATQGLVGGAGSIHGGALEKSNVDIASLFVAMIEAQNGYNANARTIKIANDMLSVLTDIIR